MALTRSVDASDLESPSPFRSRLSGWRLLRLRALALLSLGLASLHGGAAQPAAGESEPAGITLPPKAKLHLFLLVGQSNMAGRGDVEPSDKEPIPNVIALNAAGEWVMATDPVHWDKPSAGVGLARSFAVEYLKAHPGVTVGLIPAAHGGSPISTWAPGQYWADTKSHPYDDAITRARHALERGTLKGILWHQGESDRGADLAPRYGTALTELIARFRKDLNATKVPFVIGQLGQFAGAGPWDEPTQLVDRAQQEVAARVPFAAFVSSDGLTSKADNLHFDARSLREFGKRYAAAFESIQVPVTTKR